MKSYSSYILIGILAFHVVVTISSFYTMFTDYSGWTTYHYLPFAYLLYAILWTGVCYKNKVFALAYLLISLAEIGMKLFMSKSIIGNVLGDILFPANLIFIAILVLLYNMIFKPQINEQ